MQQTGSESARTAYQRDGVQYLDRVAGIFGAYKRRSFERLQPFPGMRVLDAGCGAGDDARILASLAGPEGFVMGMDIAAGMIEAARRRNADAAAKVEFVRGDVCCMECEDDFFDRVRADRVFQHLEDPERAFRELLRVTRPGGLIVLMDVDWSTLVIDGEPVELTERILRHHFSRQVNGAAGRSLYGMCKRAGLTAIETSGEAFAVTDPGLASFLWGLEPSVRNALESGVINAREYDVWTAGIKKSGREGSFFSAVTGFEARGYKTGKSPPVA